MAVSKVIVDPRVIEQLIEVPFSFNTPSPLILGAIVSGQVIGTAAVQILTPFNDNAAQVTLGTSADPGALLSTGQVRASAQGQYETGEIYVAPVNDLFQLSISPGASTQGTGRLFYRVRGLMS